MATDPKYGKITVDEFLAIEFRTDRKYELVDGVIQMMTGGTEPHAWIQVNITSWLRAKLKGSRCRPYGSEMGVQITDNDLRYPDASIFCSPRPANFREMRSLPDPVVVIEILSPSTAKEDQGVKSVEYKAMPSVQVIGFIDPLNELVKTVTRTDSGWVETFFAAQDLDLGPVGLTIPHAEIFALD
jgi:Uma2 family endonuclease